MKSSLLAVTLMALLSTTSYANPANNQNDNSQAAVKLTAAKKTQTTDKRDEDGLTDLFTSAQQDAIAQIATEYLINNPEFLVKASNNLRKKEAEKKAVQQKQKVQLFKDMLLNDKETPYKVEKGSSEESTNVAVIKFLDYQCSYCIKSVPIVDNILAANKNVKLIIKNYPVLAGRSPLSTTLAQASLEAYKQGGVEGFTLYHDKIMALKLANTPVNEAEIQTAMETSNLIYSPEALKNWASEINQNNQIAKALYFSGTPAYIIMPLKNITFENTTIIPGFATQTQLQQAIKKATPQKTTNSAVTFTQSKHEPQKGVRVQFKDGVKIIPMTPAKATYQQAKPENKPQQQPQSKPVKIEKPIPMTEQLKRQVDKTGIKLAN
ncbi:thioredoxin domain-containing protein [Vibrio sp. SS-MA-C1-2]|uniref:DsbA family protein n=1 Tax=Vibrio sp. SS-MA-C1-2 TaxID=2908646 RepID=UPI001F309ED7|nr:thioredoxin domain-containing protein [Vibrio sp. SS-MA-C1-2]UJF19970.1 thioredoxin domain-containing protein [Vibrio sp. SS-MA-C1-2]